MASTYHLRTRRTAAQLRAVEQLEQELRARDPYVGCKYLRDFRNSFQDYQSVLQEEDVKQSALIADVVLIGDYHALPTSQRFAAQLLETLSRAGRKVVLGVEFVYSKDQNLLDSWRSGAIDGHELRERLGFDFEWGYDWQPFLELLGAGREYAEWIYGLDCVPRRTLRRIAARDRHAAARIADMRAAHPDAVPVVLFGESHLAPAHLPRTFADLRPTDRVLTVLQNIDALYWKAAGERCERVEAVRVQDGVVCVFNATPLEKYESYRVCINRWQQEEPSTPDMAPAFHNMVWALLRFLNVDEYSPTTGAHAGFELQRMPQVRVAVSEEQTRRQISREGVGDAECKAALARLAENGIAYVPRTGTVFLREFSVSGVAEEAARFVHEACQRTNRAKRHTLPDLRDEFYGKVIEEALAYFGSRALLPGRAAVREIDLYALYLQTRETVEEFGLYTYHEFMDMVDFLALHKDYEANCGKYRELPEALEEGVRWAGPRSRFVTLWLGRLFGEHIYRAYVSGKFSKRSLRALFQRNLNRPGVARTTYFSTARKLRTARKAA